MIIIIYFSNTDEEENGKSSSSKDLRTSKPSECESSHDPQGVATQDGDELFQSDEEDDYDGDEEGQVSQWLFCYCFRFFSY